MSWGNTKAQGTRPTHLNPDARVIDIGTIDLSTCTALDQTSRTCIGSGGENGGSRSCSFLIPKCLPRIAYPVLYSDAYELSVMSLGLRSASGAHRIQGTVVQGERAFEHRAVLVQWFQDGRAVRLSCYCGLGEGRRRGS